MTDTLSIQRGSRVKVRGIREAVTVTFIRTNDTFTGPHFSFDFTDHKGNHRTYSTSQILKVLEDKE